MKLELWHPIKPFRITQIFGINGEWYQAHGINIKGHNGLDLQAVHGQPVYASHDGEAYYEVDGSQGHGVIIRSSKPYLYNGEEAYFKTIYWHLCDGTEPQFKSPITVTNIYGPGQPVKVGDIIGYANSTGFSTMDHLHFALKPQTKNEPNGLWFNIEQDNGYYGAIDPQPYLNGLYAQDYATWGKLLLAYQQLATLLASLIKGQKT